MRHALPALTLLAAAIAQAGPLAYVSNEGSGTLSVIDTATDAVLYELPAGAKVGYLDVAAGKSLVELLVQAGRIRCPKPGRSTASRRGRSERNDMHLAGAVQCLRGSRQRRTKTDEIVWGVADRPGG